MKKIFVLLLVLCFVNSAWAIGGYVGGGIGSSTISTDQAGVSDLETNTEMSMAVRVGMVFANTFSLGLNISSWMTTYDEAGLTYTISKFPVALEANWHILETNNGPYFGPHIATVLESRTVEFLGLEARDSDSGSGVGAQLGWNIGLGARHSVGIEGRYTKVDSDIYDYDFMAALVMYSFWFGGGR